MTLFGLMPGVGPVQKWGFDLGGYKSALKNNMDRELDYRDEAARQEQFRGSVDVQGLIVPRIFTEFSARRILIQEWQEGSALNEVAKWPRDDRKGVARILLATLLRSLFVAGEVHGDPHAGNFMFKKLSGGVSVVLVDFGCTVPVAREKRLALLKMIIALREKTPLPTLEAFAAVGFGADKLCAISGTLAPLAHTLLKPFKTPSEFFVQQWHLKTEFENLLGENRWWFRAAGEPTQILLLRAFHGLVQQLETIKYGLDWWQVLTDTIPPSLLDEARAYEVPGLAAEISRDAAYVASSLCIAKALRVNVKQGRKQIVSLTMPARAALNLQQLIPEDVTEYLRQSPDWDLDAIIADVRARGIEPQEILNFEKDAKSYRIWLE
jgi:predicted unusual protein kinase regulating ubiquinone biosynthesis (AarF/ABC1/UbiB family)